jgi:hypothetical protein
MSRFLEGLNEYLYPFRVPCALLALAACADNATAPRLSPPVALAPRASAVITTTISFASDASWSAQLVCLNASAPVGCAPGSTLYGFPGAAWAVSLSPIPGAAWIWAPGITGSSTPAYPAKYSFSKTFDLPGAPAGGTISLAADDSAAVIVNGTPVGSVGSTSNAAVAAAATNSLRTFDIGPYLIAGINVIAVNGANGNFGCFSVAYRCNPAGVVFGGSLSYTPNSAPTISMSSSYSGVEGAPVDFSGITLRDPNGDELHYTVEFGDTPDPVALPVSSSGTVDNTSAVDGAPLSPVGLSHIYGDNGTYTLTVTVTEIGETPALTTTAQAAVTVSNGSPVISRLTLPESPVAVGTSITVTAQFIDAGWRDSHTALFQWDWDSATGTSVGSSLACPTAIGALMPCAVSDPIFDAGTNTASAGALSGANIYTSAGVYTVRVGVTDDDHATQGNGTAARVSTNDIPAYVVVYDPSAGFVAGGGWIDSPPGACRFSDCVADGSTTGKAHFGFVSRYQKGATTPSGNTEFDFRAGNLKFQSTSYEWLVIAGARAKYKGEGTINGGGRYGFMLTAIDGQVSGGGGADRFRVKIWDLDAPLGDGTYAVVYDNQIGQRDDGDAATVLGGGSITIHGK